jgi:hypothetical protein
VNHVNTGVPQLTKLACFLGGKIRSRCGFNGLAGVVPATLLWSIQQPLPASAAVARSVFPGPVKHSL